MAPWRSTLITELGGPKGDSYSMLSNTAFSLHEIPGARHTYTVPLGATAEDPALGGCPILAPSVYTTPSGGEDFVLVVSYTSIPRTC